MPAPKANTRNTATSQLCVGTFLTFLALIAAVSTQIANAQLIPERFAFDQDASYESSIPSPGDFLGYELGEQYTPYYRIVEYLKSVSEISERVTIHPYGFTHEGRPLHYLVITSVDNQSRVGDIRMSNLRLAQGDDLPEVEATEIIRSQPAISWLSYNVHGNEGSGSEASMQVVYRLAAANDEVTLAILENSVVVIDPCINADGRDRYVWWYKSMQSEQLNDDSSDLEHVEPWPGGRTNHYWFDLNRDWVWLVHPSSQGRIDAYQQWLPQMHTDYHEQGFNNNYFTMPGQSPRNLLLPDAYDEWADRFGRANAAAFDKHHISYFTRESFDFFYPGYGSSYPSIMGGIGMLTEQGGHSRGGRAVETEDGHVLTLRQRIFDHYLTSFAALETVADNRQELLGYFRSTFEQSANEGPAKAYLLPDNPNDLTRHVVSILLKHGVKVLRADNAFEQRAAFSYETGRASERTFDAGTFIVPTNQPKHMFVNTILARNMAIEDSVMYDMATWSAPLAYNLDAAWTETAPTVTASVVEELPMAAGRLSGDAGRAYAFVVDWKNPRAPTALALLWEAGYKVRSVRKPFTVGDQKYSRGSLVVLVGRNPDKTADIAVDMTRIAQKASVEIVALESGRVDAGIDLASPNSRPVARPKVGMFVGSPFSSYTAGQIWYLFDKWTGFGISRLPRDSFSRLDLDVYDVLILPGGSGSALFDSVETDRLKRWVRAGGTLVATEGSAVAMTAGRMGLTSVNLAGSGSEKDGGKDQKHEEPPASAYTVYEARSDSSGLKRIPGSAFLGHLDTTNPLAFGMAERLYSLRMSSDALLPSDDWQTVGYFDKDPGQILVSGYASVENRKKLTGMAFAGVQEAGDGKVVFLVDNTQYRMFWIGPSRLMQNAVMLIPGM